MNTRLNLLTMSLIMFTGSAQANITIAAPPATYASSWRAFGKGNILLYQGTFEFGPQSASTGYRYATIPNNVSRIENISQGYRHSPTGPVLDFEMHTAIDQPENNASYTLQRTDNQIIVNKQ